MSVELLLSHSRGLDIQIPFVPPPRWASSFHHFSFSRIAALALTQFRKVIVMDNDMALRANIDDLASDGARAPGMVFHTATVLPKKARSPRSPQESPRGDRGASQEGAARPYKWMPACNATTHHAPACSRPGEAMSARRWDR